MGRVSSPVTILSTLLKPTEGRIARTEVVNGYPRTVVSKKGQLIDDAVAWHQEDAFGDLDDDLCGPDSCAGKHVEHS